MLREEQEYGLRPVFPRAVSEPCGQRDSRGVLGGDARHVEHNGAEAPGLQKQICDTESVLDARPRFGGVDTHIRACCSGQWLRRKGFSICSYSALWLRAARRNGLWPKQAPHGIGESIDFIAWMSAAA